MQLENTFTVPVPVDDAWRVLLDVERIAPCMPGATLDEVDGDTFHGRVKVKVGPITVTYKGTATFVEKDDASHRAVIEGSGKEARGSGTAKATVTTTLHPQGDRTEVRVVTDLNVTGRPAQFGRGVMADVSAKLIDQFAQHLSDEIEHGGVSETGTPEEAAGQPAVEAQAAAQPATATTPLPPAGAPTEPAPAPATPLSAVGAPSSGPRPAAQQERRRSAEAIDLFEAAGSPVLQRLAPVVGAAAVLALLIWLLRRKR